MKQLLFTFFRIIYSHIYLCDFRRFVCLRITFCIPFFIHFCCFCIQLGQLLTSWIHEITFFTIVYIDFETGLLSITKTLYYRTMTDYKFVEPKTQASIRTIYIDSDTLNELKAWQSVQQQVLPDCPLVLSYNGTPTSKTTLPRALEKLSNLAGVHRIKIHALRHSHASLLISIPENYLFHGHFSFPLVPADIFRIPAVLCRHDGKSKFITIFICNRLEMVLPVAFR